MRDYMRYQSLACFSSQARPGRSSVIMNYGYVIIISIIVSVIMIMLLSLVLSLVLLWLCYYH